MRDALQIVGNEQQKQMKIGLNLGCGLYHEESTAEIDWCNVDADPMKAPDLNWNVRDFHGDSEYRGICHEILAKDILEHIPPPFWEATLKGWIDCLCPGGTIRVQVPSPECIFREFTKGTIDEATMNRVIYGECTTKWDRHYQLFTIQRLRSAMEEMGLEIIEAYELHVCAIVIGRKPE